MQGYLVAITYSTFQKGFDKVFLFKGFYTELPRERRGKATVYPSAWVFEKRLKTTLKPIIEYFPTAEISHCWSLAIIHHEQHMLNSTYNLDGEKRK